MRRLLGRSLRLAALAAAGLCTVAVLLGHRYRPAGDRRLPEIRSPAVPRYVGVSHLGLSLLRDGRRVLDAEAGAIVPCAIADPGLRGVLGCSPWRDAAGQFHIVARAVDPAGDPRGLPSGEMVLVRYTYPGGRVLDRVVLDRMPHGPVCWSHVGGDRILFASLDGRLYRYDFAAGGRPGGAEESPRPIRWGRSPRETEGVFLQDPCWPAGPYPPGWMLVTVRVRVEDPPRYLAPRLWWLRLEAGEGAIVEARRAIEHPGEGSSDGDEEHLPAVGMACDGTWHLAYLVHRCDRPQSELRVALLRFEASDSGPLPVPSGRAVAEGCLAMAPAFSPDGRWIHAAVPDEREGVRIERLAVSPTEERDPPLHARRIRSSHEDLTPSAGRAGSCPPTSGRGSGRAGHRSDSSGRTECEANVNGSYR